MLHRQKKIQTALYLRIRELARTIRKNPTEAEQYFWEKSRDRRLFGLKINRQYILRCLQSSSFTKYYIADFHCFSLKTIFELDGQIHLKQQEKDLMRTEDLLALGYTVMRFPNDMVLNHWEEVERMIYTLIISKKTD